MAAVANASCRWASTSDMVIILPPSILRRQKSSAAAQHPSSREPVAACTLGSSLGSLHSHSSDIAPIIFQTARAGPRGINLMGRSDVHDNADGPIWSAGLHSFRMLTCHVAEQQDLYEKDTSDWTKKFSCGGGFCRGNQRARKIHIRYTLQINSIYHTHHELNLFIFYHKC